MIQHLMCCKRLWPSILLVVHQKNNLTLKYFPFAGREEWAARREAKAEGREGEPGAADQVPECPAKPRTTPPSDPSLCVPCSPGASNRRQAQADDACDWLPWIPDVAVHAAFRCWHLWWPEVLSSCGVEACEILLERGDAAFHWFKSWSVRSVVGVVDSRTEGDVTCVGRWHGVIWWSLCILYMVWYK